MIATSFSYLGLEQLFSSMNETDSYYLILMETFVNINITGVFCTHIFHPPTDISVRALNGSYNMEAPRYLVFKSLTYISVGF